MAGPGAARTATGRRLISEYLDDHGIVARCQDELPFCTEAFEQLTRRYEPVVYRVCLRVLADESDADDACQETFVRTFRNIKTFEHRSTFKTWLLKIARNECLTLISRRTRVLEMEVSGEEGTGAIAAAKSEDTEVLFSSPEELEKTLRRLPARDREVLTLRFVTGVSLEEVAEIMEISLSAAKMRLYRAMRHFVDVCREIREPGGSEIARLDPAE